jgi:predicted Zn-dependent peptidase
MTVTIKVTVLLIIGMILSVGIMKAQSGKIRFTQFELENGLHVIVHEDHATPIVAVNICYHVGSKNERPDKTGFAHLFEHLMFDGSTNVQRGEFDVLTTKAGGYNNAYTSEDVTNYYEVFPAHQLELALWLESDRMLQFAIQEASLDTQRDVVKEERRYRYENSPYGSVWVKIPENTFKVHPYRWPVIGYQESLDSAALKDVKEFYETFYVPNNATLAIAGDVDASKAKILVQKYFGEIPRGTHPIPKVDIVEPPLVKEYREVVPDNVELPAVFEAFRIPEEGSSDYYALSLLTDILSDGESSRLYKKMVYDEQIASEVDVYVEPREQPGILLIYTISSTGGPETLESSIWEELEKVKTTGVTERELEKAKNKTEASYVGRLQSNSGKADLLAHYYTFFANADLVNTEIERFLKVTPEDINRVAIKYLSTKNRVVFHYLPRK